LPAEHFQVDNRKDNPVPGFKIANSLGSEGLIKPFLNPSQFMDEEIYFQKNHLLSLGYCQLKPLKINLLGGKNLEYRWDY
jgi:hypothetical protein